MIISSSTWVKPKQRKLYIRGILITICLMRLIITLNLCDWHYTTDRASDALRRLRRANLHFNDFQTSAHSINSRGFHSHVKLSLKES